MVKRHAWNVFFLIILIGVIWIFFEENTVDVINNKSPAESMNIRGDATEMIVFNQSNLILPVADIHVLRNGPLREELISNNRGLVSIEINPKPTLPQGTAFGWGESISLNISNQLGESQYSYGNGSFTKDMPSTSIASHKVDSIPDRPIAEAIELAREASAQSIGAAGINPFSTIHK